MLVGPAQSAPLFIVQLRGLEARGHMSNQPKRQRTPFRLVRHMLVASGKAPPLFFQNIDFFTYACVLPLVCAIIKGMKIDGVKGVNIR